MNSQDRDSLVDKVLALENARRGKLPPVSSIPSLQLNLPRYYKGIGSEQLTLKHALLNTLHDIKWSISKLEQIKTNKLDITLCPATVLDKMRETPTIISPCKCACHRVE